jgi:hypothetical protein
MRRRFVRVCVAIGASCLLPFILSCQNQPGNLQPADVTGVPPASHPPAAARASESPGSESYADLTTAVRQLTEQVRRLDEAINGTAKQKDVDELRAKIAKLESDRDTLADTVREMDKVNGKVPTAIAAELGRLRSNLEANVTAVAEQQNTQRELLAQIARTDSKGHEVLRLPAIMEKSPEFRGEFAAAVRQSLPAAPPAGTIRVENNMLTGQWLRINGVDQWIAPYSAVDIPVPTGTATTELVGYESPKNWFIGPPNFVQRILINPNPYAVAPVAAYAEMY